MIDCIDVFIKDVFFNPSSINISHPINYVIHSIIHIHQLNHHYVLTNKTATTRNEKMIKVHKYFRIYLCLLFGWVCNVIKLLVLLPLMLLDVIFFFCIFLPLFCYCIIQQSLILFFIVLFFITLVYSSIKTYYF